MCIKLLEKGKALLFPCHLALPSAVYFSIAILTPWTSYILKVKRPFGFLEEQLLLQWQSRPQEIAETISWLSTATLSLMRLCVAA